MPPSYTKEEWETFDEYERGWLEGVWLYSWMKDGVLYVGTTGRTYADAVDNFLRDRGKRSREGA